MLIRTPLISLKKMACSHTSPRLGVHTWLSPKHNCFFFLFFLGSKIMPTMISSPSVRRSPRLVDRPCSSIVRSFSAYSKARMRTVQFPSRSIASIHSIRRTSKQRGYPRLSYYGGRTPKSRSVSTSSTASKISKMSSFAFAFEYVSHSHR
jgi:hypothetical protein